MNTNINKVHFVGAGPGDKELITLKGYKLLSNADVVIYAGSLVNPELLDYCKEGCEIHDSAYMTLEEIINVMEKGIKEERKRLKFLRERADYLIDSSHMLTRELRAELSKIFVENKEYKNLYISVLSFGFKYGIPADADLIFDVRFLPNPYYIDELRPKSGNDKEVREYVMNNDKAKEFLAKLTDMVEFLIPNYVQEGKTQLVIGIGCTGGKHRSVTLANELYEELSKNENYGIRIEHRDIEKDAITKAR